MPKPGEGKKKGNTASDLVVVQSEDFIEAAPATGPH